MIKEVICVKETTPEIRAHFIATFRKEPPVKDKIYTVIGVHTNADPEFQSSIFYELAEITPSDSRLHYFGSLMFADLPEDLTKEIEKLMEVPEPSPAGTWRGHECDAFDWCVRPSKPFLISHPFDPYIL